MNEFERRFAEYIGTKYCIAVANGTQAMELALRALDTNEGEVITTANAGMYSSCAILSAGFTPIYAEIDPVLMTPEPASVALAIAPQTRALMVTHLYGQMADMRHLSEIAHASGLPLIEDCAEAHGASILKGVTVGDGCVIAANSTVTRDVAPYTPVAGNPARVIRALEPAVGTAT